MHQIKRDTRNSVIIVTNWKKCKKFTINIQCYDLTIDNKGLSLLQLEAKFKFEAECCIGFLDFVSFTLLLLIHFQIAFIVSYYKKLIFLILIFKLSSQYQLTIMNFVIVASVSIGT